MPDFFVAIGDLITGSFLQTGSLWILTNVPGFPPIIQTVHILGIAVVMGTAVLLNLRLLGLAVPSKYNGGDRAHDTFFMLRSDQQCYIWFVFCFWKACKIL